MRCVRQLMAMAALALLVPVLALADSPGDSLEENRQELARLRDKDPQRYAQLRRDLAAFRKLPPERQEVLRQLQRDLQDEPPQARARLEHVLERYTDWLDHLPEADRQSVLTAPDRKARLQRIRDIRMQQWVSRLPKVQAEKVRPLLKAHPDQVRKLWQDDVEQRLDWQVAVRHWDALQRDNATLPSRLDMLPKETGEWVKERLLPLLSADEEKMLKDSEGKWPRYPRLLVEMADNHPYSLLGPIGPTRIDKLPAHLQTALEEKKSPALVAIRGRLKNAEGRWPDFGEVLHDWGKGIGKKAANPMGKAWMPALPKEFSQDVRVFLDRKLLPALDEEEKGRLGRMEGNWPAYPRTVLELARKHNLQVPPGNPYPFRGEFWNRYRIRPLEPPAGKPAAPT